MIKHRVTFFNPTGSNDNVIEKVSLNYLKVAEDLEIPREDKYKIIQSELPAAIKLLRLQWSKPLGSNTAAPLFVENQVQQPGLHIYASPEAIADADVFFAELNDFVSTRFGFQLSSQDWVPTTYSVLVSIDNVLLDSILQGIKQFLQTLVGDEFEPSLLAADNLDIIIDKDTTTCKTLIIDSSKLSLEFKVTSKNVKHEIGVFMLDDKVTTIDDLMLSGVRFVIDPLGNPVDKLEQTLFHVKPRHRLVPGVSADVSIETPQGLHPTLKYKVEGAPALPDGADTSNCKLFYYQTLSKSFFIDKYQLPKNFSVVSLYGNLDLEAPEYKVDGWGVESLMNIEGDLVDFEFTIHSRYQEPTEEGKDMVEKVIYPPNLFYACSVDKDEHLLGTSPFDYTSSLASNVGGFQSYFTDDTVFYHVTQESSELLVSIPRGKGDAIEVNQLTVLVLGLGIAWLFYKFIKILLSRSEYAVSEEKKKE